MLNSEGHTSGELAKILQALLSKVFRLVAAMPKRGSRRTAGRMPIGPAIGTDGKQQQELEDILDSGPADTTVWIAASGRRP
ncbi:MAG: hypothetical protein ACRD22_12220 [Terriglobia bacterium]